MTSELTLVRPSIDHADEIAALRAEFLTEAPHIPGGSRLEDFDDPADWIDYCAARQDPATVPDGFVQADLRCHQPGQPAHHHLRRRGVRTRHVRR